MSEREQLEKEIAAELLAVDDKSAGNIWACEKHLREELVSARLRLREVEQRYGRLRCDHLSLMGLLESAESRLAQAGKLAAAAREMDRAYHAELLSLAARFARREFVLNLDNARDIRDARLRRDRQDDQHGQFSLVVKNAATDISEKWRTALADWEKEA